MTDKYLDSAAGGTASGDDWTNAYTSYSSVTLTGNTDRVFIASGHSDNSDNIIQGTASGTGPYMIQISVDKTGSPEPPNNTDILAGADINISNSCYLEGITFTALRHINVNLVVETCITKDCTFEVGLDDSFLAAGTSSRWINYNATLDGNGTGGDNTGGFNSTNGAGGSLIQFFGGQTTATGLQNKQDIIIGGAIGNIWEFYEFDFTNWGVNTNTAISNTGTNEAKWKFFNCKFPHGATSFGLGTSFVNGQGRIECYGCGLVDNTSQEQGLIHDQYGDMEVWGGGLASRAVYRTTNGATPPHQTNPISWNCTVTSRCGLTNGFVLSPMMKYYSTTGSTITVTIHYLLERTSAAVDPLDDSQIVMHIEYYDATGVLMKYEDTFPGVLGTLGGETNHSTSGASWTTTDAAANTGAYSFSHTTASTLAQEGFVRATLEIKDLGTNDSIFIDPIMVIT
jgi:hypothetical protein